MLWEVDCTHPRLLQAEGPINPALKLAQTLLPTLPFLAGGAGPRGGSGIRRGSALHLIHPLIGNASRAAWIGILWSAAEFVPATTQATLTGHEGAGFAKLQLRCGQPGTAFAGRARESTQQQVCWQAQVTQGGSGWSGGGGVLIEADVICSGNAAA